MRSYATRLFSKLPPAAAARVIEKETLVQAQKRFKKKKAASRSPAMISPAAYWKACGNAVGTTTENDQSILPYVGKFAKMLKSGENTVFEIGCGKGKIAEELKKEKEGINYTGIDICPANITEMRQKFAGTQMDFVSGDIRNYSPPRRYTAAIAIDIFSFLSPEEQILVLLKLNKLLYFGSPLLLRYYEGLNNFIIKTRIEYKGEKLNNWGFFATKSYLEDILAVTGFSAVGGILKERAMLFTGTEKEAMARYLIAFAGKEKHFEDERLLSA